MRNEGGWALEDVYCSSSLSGILGASRELDSLAIGNALVYFCLAGRSTVGLPPVSTQPSLLSDQDLEAL